MERIINQEHRGEGECCAFKCDTQGLNYKTPVLCMGQDQTQAPLHQSTQHTESHLKAMMEGLLPEIRKF